MARNGAMLRCDSVTLRSTCRVWFLAIFLIGLYLIPVAVSFCLPDPRGGVPWHQARRDPTGLSPDPAAMQEAVIQVFAAPAVSWRGIFSVHTWIAVKPTGASRFTRYEVLGFGVAHGTPAVRIDRMGPDNYWFGARPQLLLLSRQPPGLPDSTVRSPRRVTVRACAWP